MAHASTESGLRTNVIHDNGSANGHGKGDVYTPETPAEAVRIARQLLSEHHSLDAGVMQVNSANWPSYGLTVETAFDPARNICAGARILGEAFQIERRAACRYNAGRPDCGDKYPDMVQRAELRLGALPVQPIAIAAPPSPPPCAPAWDQWALAACSTTPATTKETASK